LKKAVSFEAAFFVLEAIQIDESSRLVSGVEP